MESRFYISPLVGTEDEWHAAIMDEPGVLGVRACGDISPFVWEVDAPSAVHDVLALSYTSLGVE